MAIEARGDRGRDRAPTLELERDELGPREGSTIGVTKNRWLDGSSSAYDFEVIMTESLQRSTTPRTEFAGFVARGSALFERVTSEAHVGPRRSRCASSMSERAAKGGEPVSSFVTREGLRILTRGARSPHPRSW